MVGAGPSDRWPPRMHSRCPESDRRPRHRQTGDEHEAPVRRTRVWFDPPPLLTPMRASHPASTEVNDSDAWSASVRGGSANASELLCDARVAGGGRQAGVALYIKPTAKRLEESENKRTEPARMAFVFESRHLLPKVEVASSSLVTRSRPFFLIIPAAILRAAIRCQ